MNGRGFSYFAFTLVIIGAINWGLIGFFSFDLIATLFGATFFSKLLYSIIGLAGLYTLSLFSRLNLLEREAKEEHHERHAVDYRS